MLWSAVALWLAKTVGKDERVSPTTICFVRDPSPAPFVIVKQLWASAFYHCNSAWMRWELLDACCRANWIFISISQRPLLLIRLIIFFNYSLLATGKSGMKIFKICITITPTLEHNKISHFFLFHFRFHTLILGEFWTLNEPRNSHKSNVYDFWKRPINSVKFMEWH